MAKRSKLAAVLDETADQPAVRALMASVAAGGAIAAGKVVSKRVAKRGQRKRRRYRLEPGEAPIEGVGRIARGQLDLTIGLLHGDDRDGDGQPIHDARKALKRIRALLRISRGLLGDKRYRRENTILRDAGRSLSDARDAQVLLATLDDLAKQVADQVPQGTWSRFREALAAELSAASETDGDSAGVVGALSEARSRVTTWPPAHKGDYESLADGLKRIYGRGRRAARVAKDQPSTENLHELRKRAKELWYAAQLLRTASPQRMKRLARRAHRLSDLLGDDHDLSVLLDRAHAQPGLLRPGELELLEGLIERRREVLRRAALARAARLYRRKPRKFVRRLAPA
jgi:CHAD domain-containing protein